MSNSISILSMDIGTRILKARENKKLSQEQLGQKIGVSASAVNQWENNITKPNGMNLNLLCDVLQVTTKHILEGDVNTFKLVAGVPVNFKRPDSL